jgi:superfamily I DNA and/or RNA helicase
VQNLPEARVVARLLKTLWETFPSERQVLRGRIAVIAFYTAQVSLLRQILVQVLGAPLVAELDVEIGTIDGMQVREREREKERERKRELHLV